MTTSNNPSKSVIQTKNILIKASTSKLWAAFTIPSQMKQWMGEDDFDLEIITDWKVGSTITIKGFHHVKFENKGFVLQFEPERILQYNYISSISHLEDKPENYTSLEFILSEQENQTLLTLNISNFPTEIIYKHVDFYWKNTLAILKNTVEVSNAA